MGVGYEIRHRVHKLECRVLGHAGMVAPGWPNARPSREWLREHARCRRCGEKRF